nr:type VII secretion protein EccE [Mycobacterium sp. AZCC_0083]
MAPQRALPLSNLLLMQALIAAGFGLGLLLDGPAWRGAVAGLVLALVLVVRRRGLSIPGVIARRLGFWWGTRPWVNTHNAQLCEPFDTDLPDGSQIGLVCDGRIVTSVLRIEVDPQAMIIMEPAMTVTGQTVSVQMLADCLQQFDIRLTSIDVISQGARCHGHRDLAAIYDAVLGPLPAIAKRSVWVVVRLDPTMCTDAVRHRGGGWDGTLRTTATATRRVANRLADAGLRPHILTAAEITHATHELSAGPDLSGIDDTWLACRRGPLWLRSFSIKPSMFTTAGLELLWTVPTHSTTVCVSLRRDERADVLKVRALARFNGYGRKSGPLRGLSDLRGRQYAALLCSVPSARIRQNIRAWLFANGDDAVRNLTLPASGCGQVVGADQRGRAVALPLFGPNIARVEICGTLHLAQQVVLRSLALGARVLIHTTRAGAWRAMVEQVGDPDVLQVSNPHRGTMQATSGRNYSVEVLDGEIEPMFRGGVTTMVVRPSHATPSPDADAALQLLDHDRDIVRVSTRAGSAVVTMVASPDEMRYIKSSFDTAGQ